MCSSEGRIAPAPQCTREFLLDYEDLSAARLANGAEASTVRKKKKPWRYRWPDEVLARLLKLNAERAEDEHIAAGVAAAAMPAKPKKSPGRKPAAGPGQIDLIDAPQKDLFG